MHPRREKLRLKSHLRGQAVFHHGRCGAAVGSGHQLPCDRESINAQHGALPELLLVV